MNQKLPGFTEGVRAIPISVGEGGEQMAAENGAFVAVLACGAFTIR